MKRMRVLVVSVMTLLLFMVQASSIYGAAEPVMEVDGTTITYTENESAMQIDAAATLSDSDGDADWDGGTLTVQITAMADGEDRITIPDNIVGSINTDGTNLLDGTTVIGTLSASEGTVTNVTTLTIIFNSSATNALVQDTLRAISFDNTSENPYTSDRTVTFTATDKNGASVNDARTIELVAVDDNAPTVATNNGIYYNRSTDRSYVAPPDEGGTALILVEDLDYTDIDTDNSLLIYTITTYTSNGRLTNNGSDLNVHMSFTQKNIFDSHILYTHDGSNTTSDYFVFTVSDPAGNALTNQTFNIQINPLDDDRPTVEVNSGLSLNKGGTKTIPIENLSSNDPDTDNAKLLYTVTTNTSKGALKKAVLSSIMTGHLPSRILQTAT